MLTGSAQLQPGSVVEKDEASPADIYEQMRNNLLRPLPVSSHLKHKENGTVYPWLERLAILSDRYDNCDQYGNTDPEAWQGTEPCEGWSTFAPTPAPQVPAPEGFRDPGSLLIESKEAPLGEYLHDTLEGCALEDRRESSLPIPTVAGVPMEDLMATLKAQIISTRQGENK